MGKRMTDARPKTNARAKVPQRDYDRAIVVRPRLPSIHGIFDIPADTCIAAHAPHERIAEHLHDHLYHLHIRYGFEYPAQSLEGVDAASWAVAMMIKADHRVDCNPPFVARGPGAEGVTLKVGGEDVHWVHDKGVTRTATQRFEAQGKRVPKGYYFSGFSTSDVGERKVRHFSSEDLKRTVGRGLRCDQHFQATWKEPRDEPIEPYDVILYLGDNQTSYHTFFRLPVVVPIGAS